VLEIKFGDNAWHHLRALVTGEYEALLALGTKLMHQSNSNTMTTVT